MLSPMVKNTGYSEACDQPSTIAPASMEIPARRGRPRSIPRSLFVTIQWLYLGGLGYRRIARVLEERFDVYTTRGSVERFVRGKPPYDEV